MATAEPVVYRVWVGKDYDAYYPEVIALFPRIAGDAFGWLCGSYAHIGQHGEADYHHVIAQTRPATHRESADLRRELRSLGYRKTREYRRCPARFHRRRTERAMAVYTAEAFIRRQRAAN